MAAAPEPAAASQATAAAAAPNTAAAVEAAQRTGRRVEVASQATEVRRVFARPDGSFTAQLYAQPVQVQRGHHWVPVDTTLEARPDGTVRPRAVGATVVLSGGGSGQPVARLGSGASAGQFSWPGPLPKPTLDGDTATYREVLDGVDLKVRVTAQGFAPRLVVKDGGAGGFAEALAWGGRIGVSRTEMIGIADGGSVAIDPPDYHRPIWESGWAKVMSGNPTTAYWLGGGDGGEAKVGYCGWAGCNGIGTARSYFQYDHGGFLLGKNILSAQFNALNTYSPSCSARWVDLWATEPIGPGTTWNNQPWASRWFMGNRFVAYGYSASCAPNWLGFDVTASVRNFVAHGRHVMTYALSAGGEGVDAYGWKKFAWNPSLVVHYNTPPHVHDEGAVDRPCAAEPNEPITGDTTPELSARVTDPDGGLVQAHFQWFVRFQPHQAVGETVTAEASSGSTFRAHIPDDHFGRDARIAFRVRGFDGRDWSNWGRWCDITIDETPPAEKPEVSSNHYPEGQSSGAPGVTGWFRFSPHSNDTDVVGFKYSNVNSPPDKYVAAPTGTVDVPITPPDTGPERVWVQSVDKAGNPGPIRLYEFIVGLPADPVGHWRLDGHHTNTSAPDASGNARHGAVSGVHSWDTGRVRDALRFDGRGHVRTSGGPPVRTDDSFTVSAWVRIDGSVPHWRTAVSIDGNRASGFYLQWAPDVGWAFSMVHADGDNVGTNRATGPASLGRWTHLAGVHDAGNRLIRVYVDGKLAGTTPHAGAWRAAGDLQIGRAKWNGADVDHFAGLIDDVKVWQRALPQSEIGALATRPTIEEGRWMLDEQSGTTAADATGNFNHATASGGVAWGMPAPSGRAVRFDGTGSLGTAGPVLRTDGSLTVSAWVYADRLQRGIMQTAVSQDGTERSAFLLGYRGDSERWSLLMPGADVGSGSYALVAAGSTPQLQEWTHLAGVYDLAARELRIYVNGERSGTSPLPADWAGWQANGPLRIGRAKWSGQAVDHWPGAIDEVRIHAGVRTDAEIQREFLETPPAPTTVHSGGIGRYVNHAGEHLTASGPVPRGYRLESMYGLPAADDGPSTRMLYVCRNGDETFTSTQADCEGRPRLGELGRVYVAPQHGLHLRPLHRCRVTASDEHFDSVDSTCEGQTVEFLLGYVRAYVPLSRHRQPDPPRDRRTSVGPVPATYEPSERLGVLPLVGGEGMQPLYACQDGTDAFTSLDQSCEGKQYLNRLGYVWSEPPPDVEVVPLTACRDEETGERYDTTADDCAGDLLGYVAVTL